MKPSRKAAQAKSGGPKKPSRQPGSKTVEPQKAENPTRLVATAKSAGPKKSSREPSSKIVGQQEAEKPTRIQGARSRATPEPSPAAAAPRQSKQVAVIALLRRPEGVTVAEIVAATGWQPHTVRGLFSGTLKKKLGLGLSSAQEDRGRVYRIIGAAGTMPADEASEDARAEA